VPSPEPDADVDGYLRRAELLADLGRYDDAAAELGFAIALEPENAVALSMLAAVHLAAERPEEALSAADRAVAAAPSELHPKVQRGMALVDLRRFKEAAAVADEVLAQGPEDAYAQRSAAAILGEARNGQVALNAAWRAVQLAPEQAEAHLVLGVVAARMQLYDLAERAYREALRLDPELAEARHNVGVVRLEQRRYAEALEHLAEAAAVRPARSEQAVRTIGGGIQQLVLYGAGYTMVAAVVVACFAAGNGPSSRVLAVLFALTGAGVVWWHARQVPGSLTPVLRDLLRTDRLLAFAVYTALAGPGLILLYAVVGTPWPLALAIVAGAVAELAVLRRR
jgi:tetratricopeptide (TPR) repeat protein